VPLVLCVLAVLGFLGVQQEWTLELAPRAAERLAPDTFSVLDRTVERVLGQGRLLWLSFGLALALWQVGATVRAAGTALNELYEDEEERPWLRRVRDSLLLAAVVLPAWVLSILGVALGGELIGSLDAGLLGAVAWVLRWVLVAALLGVVVWLVLRIAPAARRPVRYVSLGAGLVVAGWVAATLGYGVYVTEIASYGSVFGALSVVVVLTTWTWLLALVFLGGAVVDVLVRRRARAS
jgi:membrane protein